jgi:hypothetical protein
VRMSCIITCELKVMVFSPKWFAKIHFIDTRLSTHLKHTQFIFLKILLANSNPLVIDFWGRVKYYKHTD